MRCFFVFFKKMFASQMEKKFKKTFFREIRSFSQNGNFAKNKTAVLWKML